MVHKRAGPGMVVQQEVMVESKEKCKREVCVTADGTPPSHPMAPLMLTWVL